MPCFGRTACLVISWTLLLRWIRLNQILLLHLCRFCRLIRQLLTLLHCLVGGLRIMLPSISWWLRSDRFPAACFLHRILLPGQPYPSIRRLFATTVPAVFRIVPYS